MKVIIFSTDTKHHSYFINQIEQHFDVCSIVYERKRLKKNYVTGPFFSEEENEFEKRFFQTGVEERVNQKKLIEVYSVNNLALAKYIEHLKPDLGITFGVGLVKPFIFDIPKFGTINIHRGNISKYRGLDSDLWALYKKDYENVGVAVHYIDDNLDTGDLIHQEMINLNSVDNIFEIRYHTTVLATNMILNILNLFKKGGKIVAREQRTAGDYYTAMSLADKHLALESFLKFKSNGSQ